MKIRLIIFQFNKRYFVFALLLLGIEILIARYARDRIIRPYGGDFLVVILLYCIVRCFSHLSVKKSCVRVLLFSYGIEILQYFNLADKVGFKQGSVPYILLGNYFSWTDIICYTLGIITVAGIEIVIRTVDIRNKMFV